MPEVELLLFASAFVAGVLMFLAPCTLPLVPAYLAFIAGIKPNEEIDTHVNRKIIRNSLFYVIGFSVIFVSFGILAGLFGQYTSALRQVLLPVSGLLIILFGLQMLGIINQKWFQNNTQFSIPKALTPGTDLSAFVVGMAFALGWTPCVGPILATILLLAGTSDSMLSGGLLLMVFSIGLAIPFLLVALLYARATSFIAEHPGFMLWTDRLGGLFLLLIGVLVLTNNFDLTIVYGYKVLDFFGIGNLLDYY